MKRANYFLIVAKCQVLCAVNLAMALDSEITTQMYNNNFIRINRATVNEIIKLDAKLEMLADETTKKL